MSFSSQGRANILGEISLLKKSTKFDFILVSKPITIGQKRKYMCGWQKQVVFGFQCKRLTSQKSTNLLLPCRGIEDVLRHRTYPPLVTNCSETKKSSTNTGFWLLEPSYQVLGSCEGSMRKIRHQEWTINSDTGPPKCKLLPIDDWKGNWKDKLACNKKSELAMKTETKLERPDFD